MKRKLVSILTALALCLSLLPGTAWAVGETGVTFANGGTNVPLTDGKYYVAAAENKGITQQDDEPTDVPYLAYSGGTLTVYGAFKTTASITVYSDLTITGGADSSLSVTAAYGNTVCLGSGSVLTLAGSVDFTADNTSSGGSSGPVISALYNSTGTFKAADSYSGDIVLNSASSAPAVTGVPMDVKNSGSITIRGMMSSIESAVLNSKGDVSITSSSGSIAPAELTIKGANVKLINTLTAPVFTGSLDIEATGDVLITNKDGKSTAPALTGTAVISAGGNVEISSNGLPVSFVYGKEYNLTVKNAREVSITGKSPSDGALLSVPVTFEKCGKVTVTDSGTGELMADDVTVTSDKPWTATTGGEAVAMPSGRWNYGGEIKEELGNVFDIYADAPTVWKIGEGRVFYEPAAAEGDTPVLTLDNVTYESVMRPTSENVSIVAKGENHVKMIMTMSLVPVKIENGGTLNTIISQADVENKQTSYTVYGKADLPGNISLGEYESNVAGKISASMTITQGAELTIPSDKSLSIFDTTCLTNNGTIVNNGTVSLQRAAAENATSETVKGLGLTGTGSVNVVTTGADGSTATDTYTNSGTKFLTPAGTLDLSSNTGEDKLEDKGYKWEVTKETDGSGNEIITSATLTLAPGFNATSVTLPDAAVTIETTGESRIDELVGYDISGTGPQKTELTFSGTGPLTVDERINLAGGAGNTITVAEGAQVTANNGIYVGSTGESSVTVNGILKATGFTDNLGNSPAVSAGKVAISGTGVLEVSGAAGVQLNGMSGVFTNLFTVTGDGRFTADCSENNILVVATNTNVYPKGDDGNPDASKVIVLGDEYMPDNCEVRLVGNDIKLWDTENNKELTGPLTIHKNHTWETAWTQGETTHWHACEFAGCTEKQPGSEAAHFYRSCVCTVCGYQAADGTPDSGSGGSGGGGSSSYAVTVEKTNHGEVTSDRRTASQGDTVTLTVTPDSGYGLSALTVTDSRGNEIALTHQGGGTYRFTMPGRAVTVRAAFASSACTGGADCPSRAFSDLDTGKWYHEAVDYVLKNGLMNGCGSGLFGPEDNLTRAQFTQILHNKEGRPVVNYLLQYSDVADGAWYTEAIRWATSQGVVNGYGNGRFGPNDNITREQLAVMLWRYAGSPAAAGEALHFTDADQAGGYALDALGWAVEKGILNGKGGGILDPKGLATRAQATQMLKNFLRDA